MRTLKLAMAAVAAFAFNANAQTGPHGMGTPPTGFYQNGLIANSMDRNGLAFHAGGVAACDGCHVMHNAKGGVAKSTNNGAGEPAWSNFSNAYLLQGSDQSSTCLICHGDANIKAGALTDNQFVVADLRAAFPNGPSQRSPGGDFGWTRVSFTGSVTSTGEMHGHNVAAKDFGWLTDSRYTVAPGGSFTPVGPLSNGLSNFACSSCHDPHGRYRLEGTAASCGGTVTNGVQICSPGNPGTLPIATSGSYGAMPDPAGVYATGVYRLLAGKNYEPASKTGFPFVSDPPIAVAPRYYNHSEASAEARVQYGTGMSEWCKNCHPNIHMENYQSGWSGQRHPASSTAFLHQSQYNVYNTYLSSGNYNQAATAMYSSLVPFEQGNATALTPAVLAGQTGAIDGSTSGANLAASDTTNVMCLSCHRAHASAFDQMVRWDQNATFLTDGSAFTGGLYTRPGTTTAGGYYDRTVSNSLAGANGSTILGPYQRSLCNKCHGKD
jgi:hypothetical protein